MTYTDTQNCGKDASGNDLKCGKVTTGTVSSTPGSGVCAGSTFTYATIYYEWTAHNNQSNLSAPLNKVADTFNATWTAPDGTAQYTFNINVPVVRPDHETTVFVDWWPDNPTVGEWQQTLVPPRSDPTFDFSGETVQEQVVVPVRTLVILTSHRFPHKLQLLGEFGLCNPATFGSLTRLAGCLTQ